jgi:sugar phosphate permease
MAWINVLHKAPALPRFPDDQIDKVYSAKRLQVFYSVYIGYAAFYMVRKNISAALPALMKQLNTSKSEMGLILSLFNAMYAVAKLINGPWCDRSNPRTFMAVGLLGAAVMNIFFGLSSSFLFFAVFWLLNGYFQSRGSPVDPRHGQLVFQSRARSFLQPVETLP